MLSKYLTLLALAFSLTEAAPQAEKLATRHSTLVECLTENKVPIIQSTSLAWSEAIEPFNLRVTYQPEIMTVPVSVGHISKSIQCASKYNVKVQARSGGHSYAAMGLGGANGSLIIDMKKFKSLSIDKRTKIATIGAGNRLGDVALFLYKNGKRALPHGLCPGVGIGGHALHGGFGMTSRMWGTTLDNIEELQVVLADGSVQWASEKRNKDLFWALRGAGSSFGIVTHFKFRTYDAPSVATSWQVNYSYQNITLETKSKVLLAMQEYGAYKAPKEVALRIFFNNDTFQVYGVYWGDRAGYKPALQPLYDLLPTENRNITVDGQEKGWLTTLVDLNNGGQLAQPLVYDVHDTFFAKSIVTPTADFITRETFDNFFTYLATDGQHAPASWWVIFDLYGGVGSQISAVPVGTNAYSHRNSLFTVQIYSTAPGAVPPYPAAGYPFVDGIVDSIVKFQTQTDFGAYANYVDPTLTKEQAWDLYYGQDVMQRLNAVKDRVDPKRVFWNPQAIRG